ncbi:metallophosphoesterase [Klebsiella pneumoniae]|uniref:metallophosphoesterase n=1 Tax=Klebsiella pneumoniae TaxID=573 RepID=UPI000C7BB28E|nr:metallophosphoesterase [Klebsiella pneumoniae]EIY1879766.1 metallophosphoesterase [Klebsiella pneumoniae]EKJ7635812.1 metallophosphoesterase [Klebsiella pneumoniae]MCQ0531698.1 metallophosphoesterase [Klebsiella pneumoniae]PLI75543.1 serine/threonine protein phosphatase [Klebsiella pneumoniae]CAF2454239.1 Serine/threonine-protein phosphatase 1 [Klebsiella pneumoniae]
MTTQYQRIDSTNWRNIWVVGDLHGCHTLLRQKLDEIGFDTAQDLLLSVGDLIDRGKENVECLALLTQPWFRAVCGNHEQFLLDHLLSGDNGDEWQCNGGYWFFELSDAEQKSVLALLPLISVLPLVIEIQSNGRTVVICHADYPASHYAFGKPVEADGVIWSRERIEASQQGFCQEITGAEMFIFGHTPVPAPLHVANQHYINTGAVVTGNLTLLQIQEG